MPRPSIRTTRFVNRGRCWRRPLSGQRPAFMTMPVMIAAIIAFAVLAVWVSGVWEILSGMIELTVGLVMVITGAVLYCLSFPVEVLTRSISSARMRKSLQRYR